VVPSEPAARDVAGAGADASSIVVIPHGSDHLPAPDHGSAGALLDSLGVEGNFLLSVGTLEPRKNLGRLVEAYGRARPRLPGAWPLVVVGPGGWGPTPTFRTGTAPGTGQGAGEAPAGGVVASGPVDEGTLAALYERARLVAYVPLTEGFGFPPVEAMRQGTPVVASPMPSLGGGGLVVDPEDVDAIAAGLVDVASDEGLRADLVARGIQRTRDLTWMASARGHVALWESVSRLRPHQSGSASRGRHRTRSRSRSR
jgi:alpha-1,3-rhamnosyl/mannosyltransferase